MISLADIISPALILLDCPATSKKRVLEQISELCASPDEAEAFYEFLIDREKLGSTALGTGVAIPHCRIPLLHQPTGCFIRLQQGVDFDAPDGQPVFLIFGLFVPETATAEHLALLAQIAGIFSQPALRLQMMQAKSAQEIYTILLQA